MKKALILSGISWGSTRQRHHLIAETLLESGYSVDFVENIKSSEITLKKIIKKFKTIIKIKTKIKTQRTNVVPENIITYSAGNLPGDGFLSRVMNSYLVRGIGKKLHSRYDVIICYIPNYYSLSLIEAIPHDKLIYDSVRDFSKWPGIQPGMDLYEKRLLSGSDNILVDSYFLKQKHCKFSPLQFLPTVKKENIQTLNFGGHVKSFAYFGTISDHVDLPLLYDLMTAGYSIHFWGVDEIGIKHSNFYTHGYISDEAVLLKEINSQSDAIIIPYKGNMDGVIPAKLIQSMGSGLPVFCSLFYDSEKLSGSLCVFNDIAHLLLLLDNEEDLKKKAAISLAFSERNTEENFKRKIKKIFVA